MPQYSMKIFEESIKSKATMKYYKLFLEQFRQFTNIADYDALVKEEPKKLEFLLIEYVSHLKKLVELGEISPNAFPQRFAPIETFFVQNDILLNFKKIKRMFPRKVKTKGELPYTRKNLQDMLEHSSDHRAKAVVAFFASTGVRPEAIKGLQMRNLRDMDLGCKAVLIYENDQEEYWAFLTPEASKYLTEYFDDRTFHGEKLNADSPVFRNEYRETIAWLGVEPLSHGALYSMVYRILRNAKIRQKGARQSVRHNQAIFGGFRKWYETTLDSIDGINPSVVEKLMGHKNDLRGTYFNPEKEMRFETFKKAIPDLTINDLDRKDLEILKHKNVKDEQLKKMSEEAIINRSIIADMAKKLEDLAQRQDKLEAQKKRDNMYKFGSANPDT